MTSYDDYLAQQVAIHTEPCEPKVVGKHQEPSDGEIMTEPIYNCENCEESDCDYWKDYNDTERAEIQAEMDEMRIWDI